VWALLLQEVLTSEMLMVATQLLGVSDTDSDTFIKIAAVEGIGQFRVYWSSSVFLLGGLYLLLANPPRRLHPAWVLSLLLIVFALWTTQVRAFLGAVLIFLVGGWFVRRSVLMFGVQNSRAILITAWLAGIGVVSLAMSPTMLSGLGLARDVSDAARVDQALALFERFTARPWLGSGFGSYATSLVRADATYSYELVFYALLMKVGAAGIAVLLGVLFCALVVARLQDLAARDLKRFGKWAAFTTGLWFAGATNPVMLNFVGMGLLVVLFVDARYAAQGEAVE
jgi:hypothetical protein